MPPWLPLVTMYFLHSGLCYLDLRPQAVLGTWQHLFCWWLHFRLTPRASTYICPAPPGPRGPVTWGSPALYNNTGKHKANTGHWATVLSATHRVLRSVSLSGPCNVHTRCHNHSEEPHLAYSAAHGSKRSDLKDSPHFKLCVLLCLLKKPKHQLCYFMAIIEFRSASNNDRGEWWVSLQKPCQGEEPAPWSSDKPAY